MASSYFELISKLETDLGSLSQVLEGDESTDVNINGTQKPSISKAIVDKMASYHEGQRYGLISFATFSELDSYAPATEQESASFKVTNDPDTSKNGYYSWVSDTTYQKDSSLVQNVIEESNTSDPVSGNAVYNFIDPRVNIDSKATPLTYGGNFPSTTDKENFVWFSGRTIVPIVDTDLNERGIFNATEIPSLAAAKSHFIEFEFTPDLGIVANDWFTMSIYVVSTDGVYWGDLIKGYAYKTAVNDLHKEYLIDDFTYEQISPTVRKYKLGDILDTVSEIPYAVRLEVRLNSGRSQSIQIAGFNVSAGGLNFGDNLDTWLTTEKLFESVDEEIIRLDYQDTIPFISTQFDSEERMNDLVSSTPTAITDPYLLSLGLVTSLVMVTDAQDDNYIKMPSPNADITGGDYLSYSIFISSDDFSLLDPTRFRFLMFQTGGTGQQNVLADINQYEQVDTQVRRYYGTVQVEASMVLYTGCWFEFTSTALGGNPMVIAGLTYAMTKYETKLNGWEFEPESDEALTVRVDDLEDRVDILESKGTQSPLNMLLPSSFYLVEGNGLPFYQTAMTEEREGASDWGLYFSGSKEAYNGNVLQLNEPTFIDGNDFDGACEIYASSLTVDNSDLKRLPITVYTSSNTKSGSPKIALIGDSLTYQKTTSFLNSKLQDSGLTPVFLGTFADQLGTTCEGRSSWETSDYIRRDEFVNNDLTAPTYPIDNTVDSDGIVQTEAQYLALTVSSRWQYNPFIRLATGGDDPTFIFRGYIFDYRYYLDRFTIADPEIVTIALGTNDLTSKPAGAAVDITMEGLNIMYTQIRAALPTAKIALVLNSVPNPDLYVLFAEYIRKVIEVYGNREGENIHILTIDTHRQMKTIFDIDITSTDSIGVETGRRGDFVHAEDVGRSQWAQVLHHFVMNMV